MKKTYRYTVSYDNAFEEADGDASDAIEATSPEKAADAFHRLRDEVQAHGEWADVYVREDATGRVSAFRLTTRIETSYDLKQIPK